MTKSSTKSSRSFPRPLSELLGATLGDALKAQGFASTEIISRWFSGGEWQQFAALAGLLITLGAVRVVAVRYRPVTGPAVQPPSQMSLSFP